MSFTFFIATRIPAITDTAITLFQSTSPRISMTFEPISPKACTIEDPRLFINPMTFDSPSLNPLINPCITFFPISNITVDGEWIPSTPLIASTIFFPIVISNSGTTFTPSESPFLRPWIMFLPTSTKLTSFNIPKPSRIFATAY